MREDRPWRADYPFSMASGAGLRRKRYLSEILITVAGIAMSQIEWQQAKEQFAELVERAANGEAIIIAKDNKPLAQLGPVSPAKNKKDEGLAQELLESPLVGLWKDRDDIKDSVAFARELREKAQRRVD